MSIISSEAKRTVLQRVVRPSPEEIRGTTKGKAKAKWERDGVQGLPEHTFFLAMFRRTVCGPGFKGGCPRKPAPYQLQYNIAAWNRICNGDKCSTLTYKSQGGRR